MPLRFFLFLILTATPALAQNVPLLTGMACLQTGNIADYHALPGKRALVVIDKQRKQYLLNFSVPCDSLQPQAHLGFRTFNPSQYACMARGDSVYSSNDESANRLCRIQSLDFFNTQPPAEPPAILYVPGGRAKG